MNDLSVLVQFFQFLKKSMTNSRQNAVKLILHLPGSELLGFSYKHLKPPPKPNNEEIKLLEKFVLILADILKSLLELHPSCEEQLDSLGIFDRLEAYSQESVVSLFEKYINRKRRLFLE